jgi:Cu+-exporting ATPase
MEKARADGIAMPAARDARALPGRGVEAVVAGQRLLLGSTGS